MGNTFSKAIEFMLDGEKVCRSGWNGQGMFLYLVPANTYDTVTEVAKAEFGTTVEYGAYIAMKTAQGNVVPWVPSQNDILIGDWHIV